MLNLRNLLRVANDADVADAGPVTVHQRDLTDYAADVQSAQRLIEQKRRELADAEQLLADSQADFIDYCKSLRLPMVIEPGIWPPRDWAVED